MSESISECYRPKINDYVVWNGYIKVEGWVYFVDSEYITIETQVIPKNEQNLKDCSIHRNNRVCVVCYPHQWSELTYVKSRQSVHE